jgi:4'-phosphopantetheinyl transferase
LSADSAALLDYFGLTKASLPQLTSTPVCLVAPLPHGIPDHCLDRAEQQRAASYGDRIAAAHFTAAHVLLRAVLSHYLCCAPADIAYAQQSDGKPILAAPHTDQLHFSLARRNDRCVIALHRTQPVGVDIEQLRDMPGLDDIAALYFSAQDCRTLKPLHGTARQRRFFELWTALEARAKCSGVGLTEAGRAGAGSAYRVEHHEPEAGWLVALAV